MKKMKNVIAIMALMIVFLSGCKKDNDEPGIHPTVTSTSPVDNATGVATNSSVTILFSVAMDPASITAAQFTVKQGASLITGVVSYAGNTATFNPSTNLEGNTIYTGTITTGAKNMAGSAILVNHAFSFTTGAAPDLLPPVMSSTDPANNATGVEIGKNISITFSETMDSLTLTRSSFTLKQGTTAILGTVSYAGRTASFNPASNLKASKVYTATIAATVKDLAGNLLATNAIWSFTTGAAPDVARPLVLSMDPATNAMGIQLGKTIAITFNEDMDASTINATSVGLMQGTTTVPGTVTYAGVIASFNPDTDLEASKVYKATVTTGVKDVAGNALSADKSWSFTTGLGPDITPPSVISTDPASLAIGVALTKTVIVTFSEALDPVTLSSSTFSLKNGAIAVAGAVTYSGAKWYFNPTASLEANTIYTATVTTGAKDLYGNALAANTIWSFTTLAVADMVLPLVISTDPAQNAIAVEVNKTVAITFSEAMNASTITSSTFSLKQGTTAIAGVVSYSGTSAAFDPTTDLEVGKVYTATLTTGAKDLAGNALAVNKVWVFTTAALPDVTLPFVNATDPSNNEIGIALNKSIAITFSEALDPLTLTSLTFTLKQGSTLIAGVVSYSGMTGTFNPTSDLEANKVYTASVTTAVKDLAGNALADNKVWSFTTLATAPLLAAVNLGTAGNYVILAKTAISTVPTSAIVGDLGLSPAATSFITGFALTNATGFATASQVTGKLFGADMAAPTPINLTTAVSNMEAAYVDAAGRPTPDFLELGSGNVGGKTLTGGLYKWAGTVTMPSSVTISGGANDVWIFQIAGNLTVSNSVNVTLAGGALAKNVFWQVAGTVSIGTTSHFEGIILSKTGITLKTGASLKGRALAQTAVILDANAITGPGN